MKLVGTVVMVLVAVFCLAVAAYADPVGEDKTEVAKAQAIAEAKAQLQPLANAVKDRFDEVLKDRKLEHKEMDGLRTAINHYQTDLDAINEHLAVYKVSLASEVYPPAVKLTQFYFTNLFLGDGRWHQDEMRILAAKEGVDVQNIEEHPPILFSVFLLFCCVVALSISANEKSLTAVIWAAGFLVMAVIVMCCL